MASSAAPSPVETWAPLLRQAQEHALDYLRGRDERRVYPAPEAIRALARLEESLPARGTDAAGMLALLHEVGSPATVVHARRYFGFVNGGVHPPAVAARWLADVWDQNIARSVMSPVVARLESVCEGWLNELLGLPEETAAGYVTGTSIAVTCALAAARDDLLRRAGWDVASRGLFGAPPLRVIVGEEGHAAVFRSLSMLGLGRDRVETVPADDQGRMRADRLPELDGRTLVIAQAGNVNTGSFDPLREITARARAAGAWVHVDGAFGLWAGASRRCAALYDGVADADSWSVDAHKTLNVPYDCGIVLCRHRNALAAALNGEASYLMRGEAREGMESTPDMSRRARVVDLWATLKTLGRDGVEALVDQLCDRAALGARLFREAGFEVPHDVVFNQLLVAFRTAEEAAAVQRAVCDSGEAWCGTAEWQGRPVIRVSVCSVDTTPEDLERTVAAFVTARSHTEAQ